jgi:arylformamidase
MELFDISLPISEKLPTWPGDPKILLKQIRSIQAGDQANVTHLSAPVHVGTHVDAPDHFLDNGKTVEEIPLQLLVGPAVVVNTPTTTTITAQDLRDLKVPEGTVRLLIKTNNSRLWTAGKMEFQEDFLALGGDAAEYLVEQGIKVVGVDYLSVAPFTDPVPTHRILLEAEILIIEGLDLSQISPGGYTLLCLPLKIQGSDGAPARALLMG